MPFQVEFYAIEVGKRSDTPDFTLTQDFAFTEQDLKSTLASYPDNPSAKSDLIV